MNDAGKITASTTFNVIVTPPPANAGIALTNNGPITLSAGSTTNASVTITHANSYVGIVNLTCAVTTSLSNPASPPACTVAPWISVNSAQASTSALMVNTTTGTTTGAYTVTVTRTDSRNATISASAQVALTVNCVHPPQRGRAHPARV